MLGVDELIAKKGIKEPDLIKFDLETAEVYALKNGDNLFGHKKPLVLLELHGMSALKAACEFIDKYDYKCKKVWEMNFDTPPVYDSTNKLCQPSSDNSQVPHMLFLYP